MQFRQLVVNILWLALLTEAQEFRLQEGCPMTIEEVDKCGTKLILIGDRDLVIPRNESELDTHCNEMFEALACVRRFGKLCLQKLGRDLFSVFVYDIRSELKRRCRTVSGRREFLRHMACGVPKERLEPIHQCMDSYIPQIEWIMKNLKLDDQINAQCCSFHQTQKCFRDRAAEVCGPVTGPTTAVYFDRLTTSFVKEAVEFTCGIYKDLNACNLNLNQSIWRPLVELGLRRGVNSIYTSPITPVIQLYNQFK